MLASLTGHGAGANILTNSGLNHFDSRRTVPLEAGHAESVLGTNATTLKLAVELLQKNGFAQTTLIRLRHLLPLP